MNNLIDRLTAWSKSGTASTLVTSNESGGAHTLADDLKELLAEYDGLRAENAAQNRHLTNMYQDQCENAFVESSAFDAMRQALAEVSPDHPALKGKPPAFGVWEKLRTERDHVAEQCVELKGQVESLKRVIDSSHELLDGAVTPRSTSHLALNDRVKALIELRREEFAAAGDLLAVIHRDGGQYTAKFGFIQSCRDAVAVRNALVSSVDNLIEGLEEARANVRRLEGVARRLEGRVAELYEDKLRLDDILHVKFQLLCTHTRVDEGVTKSSHIYSREVLDKARGKHAEQAGQMPNDLFAGVFTRVECDSAYAEPEIRWNGGVLEVLQRDLACGRHRWIAVPEVQKEGGAS